MVVVPAAVLYGVEVFLSFSIVGRVVPEVADGSTVCSHTVHQAELLQLFSELEEQHISM